MSGRIFDGKNYPTQWALNPSAYQNISNDQVDWAALAQQWIKMKETVIPPAPPPPTIDVAASNNDDGGEVPMEMDNKEDDVPPAPPAPTISGSEAWNQWNQWGQWNASSSGTASWEWSSTPSSEVAIDSDGKPIGITTIPLVPAAPTISTSFSIPPPSTPSSFQYNSISSTQPYNQVPNYWSEDAPNSGGSQVPPFIKGMRHMNRPPHIRDMSRGRDDREKTPEDDSNTTLDAAKRRQLPAWIREGLEKMEREKQKAVEREKQEILRKQELENRKLEEDEARAVFDPHKSKFDSDSEKDTEPESDVKTNTPQEIAENHLDRTSNVVYRPRKSRFRDAHSPDICTNNDGSPNTNNTNPLPLPKRSKEEILQDVMLRVRRSLTEILLEVTNEEIGTVCREIWTRARSKVPAGDLPVAILNVAPIAQITRKLGLGIYGDSNSDTEDEQNEEEEPQNSDSDGELIESLKRRQQAFKKTEQEIEARLAEEEESDVQQNEESLNRERDNTIGNDHTFKDSVDEKATINNQRDASTESLSSSGQSSRQNTTPVVTKDNNRSSRSTDSESSSSTSTNSESSLSSIKKGRSSNKHGNNRNNKIKSKSRSKSRSKKSRSESSDRIRKRRSRSRSVKSRRGYRSRSSSSHRYIRRHRSRSRDRKYRRSRSKSYNRKSRSITRSHSRGKRASRSRSRGNSNHSRSTRRTKRKTKSRSRSRDKRSRSRSKTHGQSRSYVSKSKRRSRSRSRSHRRSRSKSSRHLTNNRDDRKSSNRYRH